MRTQPPKGVLPVLLVVLVCLGVPTKGEARQEGWGAWTPVGARPELEFRVRWDYWSDQSQRHKWDVEFRNNGTKGLSFSYSLGWARGEHEAVEDRLNVAPGSTEWTWNFVRHGEQGRNGVWVYTTDHCYWPEGQEYCLTRGAGAGAGATKAGVGGGGNTTLGQLGGPASPRRLGSRTSPESSGRQPDSDEFEGRLERVTQAAVASVKGGGDATAALREMLLLLQEAEGDGIEMSRAGSEAENRGDSYALARELLARQLSAGIASAEAQMAVISELITILAASSQAAQRASAAAWAPDQPRSQARPASSPSSLGEYEDHEAALNAATRLLDAGEFESAERLLATLAEEGNPSLADKAARAMFADGYTRGYQTDRFGYAIERFQAARRFAKISTALRQQLDFWQAIALYRQAYADQQPQTVASARATLPVFRRVAILLQASGSYAETINYDVAEALNNTWTLIEIQEAIIKRGGG